MGTASNELGTSTTSNGHAQVNGKTVSTISNGVSHVNGVEKTKKNKKDKKNGKEQKDETEEEVLKIMVPPVSYFKLFRFATPIDKLILAIAIVAAMAAGCSLPAMFILFGDITNAFVQHGSSNLTEADIDGDSLNFTTTTAPIPNKDDIIKAFLIQVRRFGIGTSIIGVVICILGYIFITGLNYTAEKQAYRIRNLFLKSILRQDIGWFDTHETGDFASRVTDDLVKLQEGIGEKLGLCIFFFTTTIASLITAFVHGWELTLVILSVMPVLTIAAGIMGKVLTQYSAREISAYAIAGSIAEEVLSSIRTVVAFGGEAKEVSRYEKNLVLVKNSGIKRGAVSGLGAGVTWFMMYCSYSLAFWYGVKLITESFENGDGKYDASSLIIVFFSVIMGAMNIGQASPYMEAFGAAKSAAGLVFEVIDRVPEIDSMSTKGRKPRNYKGNIEFKNVRFNYPSRPDVNVLNGVNLKVERGQTVALVGPSGCGKSTCIQLIQRFYDTMEGQVLLDDVDVKDLNVGYLRNGIGVVSQEPILFGTTISENIKYGSDDVTDDEVKNAAKNANAHDFIMKLPKQYHTVVGERGAQLSGGQKQRIAIARALVRDPQVLLLDEATSALDTHSEAVVQQALDKARQGRTTVVVAHRLSTIKTADVIVTFQNGKVIERGTHKELMSAQGLYYSLVTSQIRSEEEDAKPEATDDPDDVSKSDAKLRKTSVCSNDESVPYDEMHSGVFGRVSSFSRRGSKKGRTKSAIQDDVVDDLQVEMKPSLSRILKYGKPEWFWMGVGIFASALMGLSIPVFAILLGEIFGTLAKPNAQEEANYYALMFLIAGIICGIVQFFIFFSFGVAGENLTMRLRILSFSAMLRQEIGWYDLSANSTGALCSKLSGEASAVQGAAGGRIGLVVQCIAMIIFSFIVSFYYQWRLALVMMPFVPLMGFAMYKYASLIRKQHRDASKSAEDGSTLAVESIANIRTVVALQKEMSFHDRYVASLVETHKEVMKEAHIRGLVFGCSQAIPFFAWAVVMFYGGYLVSINIIQYADVFKVAQAVIMGTMMVSQSVAFAPDYNKAISAASKIFQLLDRKPRIDASREAGLRLPGVNGKVELTDVEFTYPSRPDVKVLQKISLSIAAGKTVALVGSSGCGKSTVVQLLERFYDPSAGLVKLDSQDIQNLNVGNIRCGMGIVSQEPVLFDRTIAENIAYGDNTREVPMHEIIEAAKNANIHSFIANLPLGYETKAGDKGTQLSGGQKQRIAIARALVRNPRILLLDEATSALDSESEKIVQEALDRAQKGRTSITIAHRLSTIQDADLIAVINKGAVVELGNHSELLAKGQIYHKLYMQGSSAK